MSSTAATAALAVASGAALGALARWGLGLALNHLHPALPPGTLAANLIGGYLVGVAVALFTIHTQLPAEWRLFVITGVLGGLTTFSTFSVESVALLQQGRPALALGHAALHGGGSLLLTFAGLATVQVWRG